MRVPAPDEATRWAVALRFEDIPPEIARRAADLLLDTLGVAAAAGRTAAAAIAYDLAAAQFAAASEGAVPLPFDGRPVSPAGAAYAGATRIDNLDAHDGDQAAKGHAGVALVPALLAFGHRTAPSGRQALAALVAGYEIAVRAGAALHATADDYHSSGAWNALGVATVGGRLWPLDAATLARACGIAEYHAPRAPMMREIDAPSMLHDSSGWGALAGVTAVELARLGFTASPAALTAVPGYWTDLGRRWRTGEQYVKAHPVCYWAQPAVRAALALRAAHGVRPERIRTIIIETFREATRLAAGVPECTEVAQYSLAFPVAAALAHGRVGIEEIVGSGLTDPAIAALVGRTTVVERPAFSERFPAERLASVTLTLDGGTTLDSGTTRPRGTSAEPMDRAAIVEKYCAHAEPVLGAERTRAIEAAVFDLAEPNAELAPLLRLIGAPCVGIP